MKIELDYAKPESVLLAFFDEMNGWEIESFPLIKQIPRGASAEEVSAVYAPIAERLDRIFEKFCTPKKRKQGRQNAVAVGSPPDYDSQTQTVVETIYESPRRAFVETIDRKRFGKKYRYVLLKKGERWLIDGKKYFTFDGKLEKDFL